MFPKFYGLPKIHKKEVPLRPIVSSIGSITYEVAKYLKEVIGPLVGKTEHHVKNSTDFVQKIKGLEVHPSQKLVSFDVSAPFTSIPQRKRLGSSGSGWNKTTAGRTELTLMRISNATPWVVFEHHLFHLQRWIFQTIQGHSHGVSHTSLQTCIWNILRNRLYPLRL